MLDRFTVALEALTTKTRLSVDQRIETLKALHGAGLLDDGNGGTVRAQSFADTRRAAVLTQLQCAAADPRNVEMLRIIRAHARRLGIGSLFADESKPIDADALNTALRDKPLADRWRMKDMMFSLKLITP